MERYFRYITTNVLWGSSLNTGVNKLNITDILQAMWEIDYKQSIHDKSTVLLGVIRHGHCVENGTVGQRCITKVQMTQDLGFASKHLAIKIKMKKKRTADAN